MLLRSTLTFLYASLAYIEHNEPGDRKAKDVDIQFKQIADGIQVLPIFPSIIVRYFFFIKKNIHIKESLILRGIHAPYFAMYVF